MKRFKTIVSMLCIFILITGSMPAVAEKSYLGSFPEKNVFMVQTQKHTCTLIATTMMLRNYSAVNGSPYEQVTESAVRRCAWSKQYGLAQNFKIGGVSVTSTYEIQDAYDKKAYLIMCLKLHKEGIVIYDTGAPHAIWLFGYDPNTDTFYCGDTITRNGGQAIPLVDSIIKGETQADKINNIDKIWHIA